MVWTETFNFEDILKNQLLKFLFSCFFAKDLKRSVIGERPIDFRLDDRQFYLVLISTLRSSPNQIAFTYHELPPGTKGTTLYFDQEILFVVLCFIGQDYHAIAVSVFTGHDGRKIQSPNQLPVLIQENMNNVIVDVDPIFCFLIEIEIFA